MSDCDAILIAGPTASGKSALALDLAERLGGAVINADSMQVYSDLRILTARPTPDDEARAPHSLYGHVPGDDAYSAGRFAREAETVIASHRAAGRMPIVVGGTGLYFRALLTGLSPTPAIALEIRRYWRGQAEKLGAAELHAVLAARDPEMAARLRPSDPQRVTRAIEVLEATGRSLASWQAMPGKPVLDEARCVRLCVQPDRETLRLRCETRFDAMIAAGALDEVAALRAMNRPADAPVMRALGVAPLLGALDGRLTINEAASAGKAETWAYVKRQRTWLKRNMMTWTNVNAQ